MKKNFKFLCAVIFLVTAVLFTLTSCKKDNNSNSNGGGPNETSSYWEDDYRRNCLHDKVKTVTEYSNEDALNEGRYSLLQFDQNGNLIEDGKYVDSQFHSGRKYKYNQNNLIQHEYYRSNNTLSEVAEFTYGGANSHIFYIPSNFSLTDIGLQKGITGIRYYVNGKDCINIKCTSVKGNQLVFEGFIEGKGNSLILTTEGAYPAKLVGKTKEGNDETLAELSFDKDGIPTKIKFHEDSYITDILEFIVKEGFCLLSSLGYIKNATGSFSYQWIKTYNEHGYLASETDSDGEITTYKYEYDAKGNWTKQESSEGVILYRKYTYW